MLKITYFVTLGFAKQFHLAVGLKDRAENKQSRLSVFHLVPVMQNSAYNSAI